MTARWFTVCFSLLLLNACQFTKTPDSTVALQPDGSFLVQGRNNQTLRIKAYGDAMLRIQRTEQGKTFLPDNHYEMVVHHDWRSNLLVEQGADSVTFSSEGVSATVALSNLVVRFSDHAGRVMLEEAEGLTKAGSQLKVTFVNNANEHFTGLGHGFYARSTSLDLQGKVVERNYGKAQIEQAPLIVPFYLSSKGYGVFLNSMFSNRFSLGAAGEYSMAIDDRGFGGQMDYFFIGGGAPAEVLDHYTQLTGRPRLPMKAMFGLQLSDKGHDHTTPVQSDENWWKEKVGAHFNAGLPLDHLVNDNRWRAAGGKRCESKIAWDKGRFPDPGEYKQWLDENGLTITLDFNRCIAKYSDGWQSVFNLPQTGKIDFADSAPDLTNEKFRDWFWQVFFDNALNPELQYPGDALWIDEFDEQGGAPLDMLLANGRSSAEMRNYWFFLIAKALVAQGWDQSGIDQRPFVWVRGMTAGAQRYASLWSGDIYPNYQDMAGQIRGMQLAGLSGFAFWGHDAGGFFDWDAELGPDEAMYRQWAMAFGSFAPIWKPHGMGASRWPLDRETPSLRAAHRFGRLRYELMPYTYTLAHQAAATGMPMARAMLLHYPQSPQAWEYGLQYLWGAQLLVAPLTADSGDKTLWLPPGDWYPFESGKPVSGDRVVNTEVKNGELPLYAKAGAIFPRRPYAQTTQALDKGSLIIDLYAGADGQFTLIEDDDRTEAYRAGTVSQTSMTYLSAQQVLEISAADGVVPGLPVEREMTLRLFGFGQVSQVSIDDNVIELTPSGQAFTAKLGSFSRNRRLRIAIE